jgi:hypothetical protein
MAEPESDPIFVAIDRIRETAKWLIASFAAVGAALVAGSQISSIGSAHGVRLAVAVGGAVLGLGGVAFAINAVWMVLEPAQVRLDELTSDQAVVEFVRVNPDALKGQAETISELVHRYMEEMGAYAEARAASRADPSNKALEAKAAGASAALASTQDVVQLLRKWLLFAKVRRASQHARSAVLVAAVSAAAGLLAFAWGSNPPAASSGSVTATVPSGQPSICELLQICAAGASSEPPAKNTVSGLVGSLHLAGASEVLHSVADAALAAGTIDIARHGVLIYLSDHLGSLLDRLGAKGVDALFSRLFPPSSVSAVGGGNRQITVVIHIAGQKVRIVHIPTDGSSG